MDDGSLTADCRVWLGSRTAGYCGCGIIVDVHHVVSCNHVVRQCLEVEPIGGAPDDLAGHRVLVRYSNANAPIEMQVVRNMPLPAAAYGERPFDDLALLRRADGGTFPARSAALLATDALIEELLGSERAGFLGTGLGTTGDQRGRRYVVGLSFDF